jgi:regulatory protein
LADELLAAALAAIGRKERTESEMRRWLAEREAGSEECERVMAYLIENLAVDDERFADGFVEDKRRLSGWGNDRIESALYERGIPPHLISAALGRDAEESEVDRATRVLLEKHSDLGDDRARQRALGLLARRGFQAEDAYAAIRRAAGHQRENRVVPNRALGGHQGVQ